jgi:hypothetical protein
MALWTYKTPPIFKQDAIATDKGWVDPVTGEILVAITGLDVKNTDAVVVPTFGTIAVPADGTYNLGDTLTFTLTVTEDVQVQGSPYIELTIGSTVRNAVYDSSTSTPTSLVFKYVVAADDLDTNGITVATVISLGTTGRGKNKVIDVVANTAGEPVAEASLTFTVPDTTAVLVDGSV